MDGSFFSYRDSWFKRYFLWFFNLNPSIWNFFLNRNTWDFAIFLGKILGLQSTFTPILTVKNCFLNIYSRYYMLYQAQNPLTGTFWYKVFYLNLLIPKNHPVRLRVLVKKSILLASKLSLRFCEVLITFLKVSELKAGYFRCWEVCCSFLWFFFV